MSTSVRIPVVRKVGENSIKQETRKTLVHDERLFPPDKLAEFLKAELNSASTVTRN